MRLLTVAAIALGTIGLLLTPRVSSATCDVSGLADGTQVVEFTLSNGTLCLEMLGDDAPINVANFLYYVENGEYDGSLFHRHLHDFVLQGGDQRRDGAGGFERIPKKDANDVQNEPCTRDIPGPSDPSVQVCSERGNERGTIAAAKLEGEPNSASTNFFVNLVDNRENLDNVNGGFTVFARVMGNGMDYVDTLLPTTSYRRQSISGALGSFASVSLMQAPGVGDYAGCYDPTSNVAAAIIPAFLPGLQPRGDPRDPSSVFLLPTLCSATPVPDENAFVANPCSGAITSADELAVGVDPLTGFVDPFPAQFFRHSCAAVDQFLTELQTARDDASYQAAYAAQVVYIESATLTVVPEPAAASLIGAAGLTLAGLCRRRLRSPRS